MSWGQIPILCLLYTFHVCFFSTADAISCAKNPCLNRGVCTDIPGGVTCTCSSDFGGRFCQIVKPCDPNPCKNGARCNGGCASCGGGYSCECPEGYNGAHCEYRPCTPNKCQNGGRCETLRNANGYKCHCPAPWTGKNCQNNFKPYCEVNANPCKNGAKCVSSNLKGPNPGNVSRYCCNCLKGFKGTHCEERWPEANHCVHGTRRTTGGCFVTNWSYYHGCQPCAYNYDRCLCPAEWFGTHCEYPNPCISSPCLNKGVCIPRLCNNNNCGGQGEPMYTCQCPLSYGGKHCENKYAAECRLYGDPWYLTFDGASYGNQADCRQILSKTCTNNWPIEKIPAFQVWAEHKKRNGLTGISVAHKVGFDMYGIDIVCEIGKGVSVDWRGKYGKGKEEIPLDQLPWPQDPQVADKMPLYITVDRCDPLRQLAIQFRGHRTPQSSPGYEMVVYVATRQLSILFSHQLAEILKPLRVNQPCPVCGMCGNYDTEPKNDFYGHTSLNTAFLDHFVVKPMTPAGCDPYTNNTASGRKKRAVSGVKEFEPCTNQTGLALGREKCALLQQQDGPFGECNSKMPAAQRTKMFEACVTDVCYDPEFLEGHYEAFHSRCGQLEVTPGDWRTPTGLKFPCASKQEYKSCITKACIPTCNNTVPCEKDSVTKWDTVCQEGCVCKEGYIWDEISNQCIVQEKCGTTKFKFPSGFIGLGGVLFKPPVFRCCQKTAAELAERPYCQMKGWCFPPGEGARLVKDSKCKTMLECTASGTWKKTHLSKRQKERNWGEQQQLFGECTECQKDPAECDDFSNLKYMDKVLKYQEDHILCLCKEGSGSKESSKESSGNESGENKKECIPREIGPQAQATPKPPKPDKAKCSKGAFAGCGNVCASEQTNYCKIPRGKGPCVKKGYGVILGQCATACSCSKKTGKFSCKKLGRNKRVMEKCQSAWASPKKRGIGKMLFLHKRPQPSGGQRTTTTTTTSPQRQG